MSPLLVRSVTRVSERSGQPQPKQTSDQPPPHLGDRLLSSDAEAAWNDRDRRKPAAEGKKSFVQVPSLSENN